MNALLLLLLLAGCGSARTGSCDHAGATCAEYDGEHANLIVLKEFCDGTFTWGGTCDRSGDVVGECLRNGDSVMTVTVYYAPDFDPDSAETDCTEVQVGAFTPG